MFFLMIGKIWYLLLYEIGVYNKFYSNIFLDVSVEKKFVYVNEMEGVL